MKLLNDIEKEIIWRIILIQLLVLGLAIYVINHWVLGVILVISHLFVLYMLLLHPRLQRIVTVKVDAQSFDNSLQIANETLPFLRQGLNSETAHHAAEVIKKIGDVPAVAVTDKQYVLAFLGTGCERHPAGGTIITNATKEVIATGQLKIVAKKQDFNCPYQDCCECPLGAAIIAPLMCRGEVVGTVKLYQTKEGEMPPNLVKLAAGIAQLLGVQMELAELDRQTQLLTKAELDALQAQINPHFLFNTLNTISMFIRTNPETARRLLKRLAAFFRHSLKRRGHWVTIEEELSYLHHYLVLEKARFREKLRIVRDIDANVLQYKIPVLTLQPLVENSIRHGITPKLGKGTVKISIHLVDDEIKVAVMDDGVGIKPEIYPQVLNPGFGSGSGVGLSNVHERLKIIFGEEYGLTIDSIPDVGTVVKLRIPITPETMARGGDDDEIKGVNSR